MESETLDFKEPSRDGDKATSKLVADAAMCLANARGGNVVVGIRDDAGGADAFSGTKIDADYLKQRIWALSNPSLSVDVEPVDVAGARLVVVRVPESADIHADPQGRAPRRVGAECHGMTPMEQQRHREDRRGVDWSARPSDRALDDVIGDALTAARELMRNQPDIERQRLARLENRDLLRALGALRDDDRLTRAGEILFCASDDDQIVYLHRPTPAGEPDDIRRLKGPLVIAFRSAMELVTARRRLTAVTFASGQQVHLEDFPTIAVREALSNAVAHRDYHPQGPVTIAHAPQVLEVSSPGSLVAGVTPENILTHEPKPRNAALAQAIRMLGLAEQLGAGIDRMFREMLAAGKDAPAIESLPDQVRVSFVGGAPNTRIPAYLNGLPVEEREDVDALIALSTLCHRKTVDAPALAPLVQKPEASAQAALERLAQDSVGMLEPTRGTIRSRHPRYRLREDALRALGTAVRYNRRSPDEVDRKVVAHIAEYGRITNRTVRNLFDADVNRARDILRDLVARDVLVKTSKASRGPTVEYGPGPSFPSRRRRREGGDA